ncbi:MAG: RNA polymerase sigma factor [Planctomycetota bacterium]
MQTTANEMVNGHDALVEHFFRHEYGRIVAVLTRSLGIRSVDLIEDAVQQAMFRALTAWRSRGLPDDASAWLYRVARNIAIDHLRRQKREASIGSDRDVSDRDLLDSSTSLEIYGADGAIPDDRLRLLFLACHPELALVYTLAISLKIVSGFGSNEIASALLISQANAEKRIARAKEKLRKVGRELADVDKVVFQDRMEAVQATLYLIFSEGFASSVGPSPLRRDLCDEAIRLTRMLVEQCPVSQTSSSALLAVMLFHAARMETRLDTQGAIVLLEDQNRKAWDWSKIREGMLWMQRSATGRELSRYHIEAAIAWEHCRAPQFEAINWQQVYGYYEVLCERFPGPMVRLNRAIARGYHRGHADSLQLLVEITSQERSKLRPWWDCAMANAFRHLGRLEEAHHHYSDALQLALNQQQRDVLTRKIGELENQKTAANPPRADLRRQGG